MSETIYREKSLERVKSPDNLNEYIQVSNPAVWMLLAAVILLLVGFCTWAVFGQVQTVVKADALCENGIVTCYLPDAQAQSVRPGMPADVGGHPGSIVQVTLGEGSRSTCVIAMKEPLADGIYDVKIQLESLHPASLLLN